MKNKEIEELLKYLKNEKEYYYEEEEVILDGGEIVLEEEDVDLLLSYIEQLENNRDKAIELLNELSNLYDDNYTVSDKAKDIIDILKGGSDDK